MRATYSASDFTLVELNNLPSVSFNTYSSGWDRSGDNPSSATAIHHPSGDAKRISHEDNPLTTTSYGGTSTTLDDGTHFRVIDWDSGTTEGGSSGSGLWDANKRIIGQLHGGDAACGNDLSDWYGKLSSSWTGGGISGTRLSDWLDPAGTGLSILDGKNIVGIVLEDQYEPDNNSNLAKNIHSNIPQTRSIFPAEDIDWVKIILTQTSDLTIETTGTTGDTRMWLYNDDDLVNHIAYNDDWNDTYQSRISMTGLAPGIYYSKVDEYDNDDVIESYSLVATIKENPVITPMLFLLLE